MAPPVTAKKVETREVAKVIEIGSFARMIKDSKGMFAAVLPEHLKIERMIALAISSAQRNPKLLECTPSSIVLSFLQASELGLEPNSPMKQSDILPYFNGRTQRTEAQFQPRFGGLILLMMNTGLYEKIYAYNVYEGDKFKFSLGLHTDIIHEPMGEDDPEKITHVYAVAKFKSGGEQFIVMTVFQVEKRRAVSKSWQNYQKQLADGKKPSPPIWEEWRAEQFLKTAIKTLSNYLAKSTEKDILVARAVEMDNRSEIEQDVIDLVSNRPDLKALDDKFSNKVQEKAFEPKKTAQEPQKQGEAKEPTKAVAEGETGQESKENQVKTAETSSSMEQKQEVKAENGKKEGVEAHVSQARGGILYQKFMRSAFAKEDLVSIFGVDTVYRIPDARFYEAKKMFEDNPAPLKQ